METTNQHNLEAMLTNGTGSTLLKSTLEYVRDKIKYKYQNLKIVRDVDMGILPFEADIVKYHLVRTTIRKKKLK